MSNEKTKKRGELFLGISIFEIIGIVIMFGVGFIPAPEPLTQTGMKLLGALLGAVFLFSTVGLTWPSCLAWVAMAPVAKELLGSAHGIYGVTQITFGDWLTVFILLCMIMTYALTSCGFMRRLCVWFLSRRAAQKSPWAFTVFFMIMSLVIGLLIDATVAIVFLMGFAKELFERLGYKQGDKFANVIVIGLTYCAIIGYAITPLGHGAGLVGMGVFSGVSGETVPLVTYFLIALPAGIICWLGMLCVFRFIIKPDMTLLANANYKEIVGHEDIGPMDLREKLTVAIYIIVCIFWIIPGLLDIFAPGTALDAALAEMTCVIPVLLGIVAMLIIKVDGKPLLDFAGAVKSVPWAVIFMIATSRALCTLLVKDGTGFNEFIKGVLEGSVGTVSTWVLIVVVCLILCIATNLTNNLPLTTLFVSVLVPQAASIGLAPAAIAVIVTFICQSAYTLPSGFAGVAMLFGNEYNKPSVSLKSGLFQALITFVMAITVVYGLSAVIF